MSRQLPYHLRTTGAPVARPVFGDSKQLRDAGGIRIKQCPVTGGVPTRMTEASFKRACAGHRRQTGKTSYNYQIKERKVDLSACARCKGKKRPTELTIITDEEVREMGKPARNMGKCQNYGESAMVTKNNGLLVCSSCSSIQAAVKNRLEAVANAARSLGKGEDLLAALVPSGSLAIKVTSDLLREISGIVGYQGEDPAALVAAVRQRVERPCASCDAEDVLHEIREIVGYTPDAGDSGLADAVRAFGNRRTVGALDSTRDDLMRACGMDKTQRDLTSDWELVSLAAIQTIAALTDRRDHLLALLTMERADNAGLRNEIARLNGQTHSEDEETTRLREQCQNLMGQLAVQNGTLGELSAKCDRLEAEAVAYKAENARQREQQPESIGLLDVALAVIREEPVPAGKIASLIEAARGREV